MIESVAVHFSNDALYSHHLILQFFKSFTTLIRSENYVTKRQSLKLLGEILLDRANFSVMTRYISDESNLKMMMNLLRDKSRNIQFEAFHVFKVRASSESIYIYGMFSAWFRPGIRCKPEETATDRNDIAAEQG